MFERVFDTNGQLTDEFVKNLYDFEKCDEITFKRDYAKSQCNKYLSTWSKQDEASKKSYNKIINTYKKIADYFEEIEKGMKSNKKFTATATVNNSSEKINIDPNKDIEYKTGFTKNISFMSKLFKNISTKLNTILGTLSKIAIKNIDFINRVLNKLKG